MPGAKEVSMTRLDCSVEKCAYNEDNSCRLREIDVKGHEATISSETKCGSFADKACDCAKNTAGCTCKETDVRCDAVGCKFNDHYNCSANHIGIATNCSSHGCETECSSFRQ